MRYFEMSVVESYTSSTSVIQIETQPSGRNSPSKDECIRYDACARKLFDTHSRERAENISEGSLQRRPIAKPLLRHMTGSSSPTSFRHRLNSSYVKRILEKGSPSGWKRLAIYYKISYAITLYIGPIHGIKSNLLQSDQSLVSFVSAVYQVVFP